MRLLGKLGTRLAATAAVAALGALAAAAPATAQVPVEPYQQDDPGGFHNILPPGQCQNVDAIELGNFLLAGTIPANCDDQRGMYEDLVYATPGLGANQIGDYFKDGSFGTKPANVVRTYSPKAGITVQRDQFNVPHVYADSRENLMYGAGYIGAEDRLFFMDVLRHAGRGQLSGFAGGANKGMDAEQWDVAPYTEADLQKQIDLADEVYGAEGIQLRNDLDNYVAGINQYISEAYLDPTKLPGEYAAILKPLLPWKGTDVIATASLVGGIFGKGGGGELGNAEVYNAAKARYGEGPGTQAWQDFRSANDPEAPTTVHGGSFPYQDRTGINPAAVAVPDPGSLVNGSPDDAPPSIGGILEGLGGLLGGSNALLVSGAESESGHPVTVFGPQVSYFAPQILMEEDLHAPDFDARGVAFVGVNLYVLLGRGQDFAWSATSAGQDIIDTFAEKLCEPGGGAPTIDSMHYMYRGQCRPIEVLERVNVITPNPGDPSPPEVYRLEAHRTVHGVVAKRGMVNGQPVAFSKLRSTYFHEADSARGFSDFNTPSAVKDVESFQRSADKIGFTFNWFYSDDRDIGYYNSGNNPVRADGVDPEFPAWGTGEYDWKDWDPVLPENGNGLAGGTNEARYTPFSEHPRTINQSYITSWNNKQAPGYRAAEDNYGYGTIYRSQSLDERIESRIQGAAKATLAELIDAMEDAGTVDLRGTQVLPWMLETIRRAPGGVPGDVAGAVNSLQAWSDGGAHRRDRDHSGVYDEPGQVQVMDAWWPRALDAVFKPQLGDDLFNKLRAQIGFDDVPRAQGSAYQAGWYGFLEKDLRSLLGEPVQGAYSRRYCGAGDLSDCRDALVDSLRAALTVPASALYTRAPGCLDGGGGDAQMCTDAVQFRTTGGVSVNDIHWINRPTWQQAVEVQGRLRPRPPSGGGGGGGSGGAAGSDANYGPAPGAAGGTTKKAKKKRKSCKRLKSKKKRKKCRKRRRKRGR